MICSIFSCLIAGIGSVKCKYVSMYVIAIKETGLEVSAVKTKNMVMSQDPYSGQYHNTEVINPLKEWNNSDIWEQPI